MVKNYLFVCYANIDKSPTAEQVFRGLAGQRGLEIQVSSAGLSLFSNRRLTKEIADRADLIFVMENYMKKELKENCPLFKD